MPSSARAAIAGAALFPVGPVTLLSGQTIGLDGTQDGGFSRSFGFDGRDLVYGTGSGPVFRVSDAGHIEVASVRESQSRPPRSSREPCTAGDHAWDEAYEYRCVATDRWKRALLSDW